VSVFLGNTQHLTGDILPRPKPQHGTVGGYKMHTKEKTEKCDPCKKAKSDQYKTYYENNKQIILEKAKEYLENNRDEINKRRKEAWPKYKPRHDAYVKKNNEKIRARERAHYRANRDRILGVKREYQKNNKDKIHAKRVEWEKANRETINARKRKYNKENNELVTAIKRRSDRKRRSLIAGNGFEKYTENQVLDTYGSNCHICKDPIDLNAPRQSGRPGWQKGLHIDHIIPISKGGPDTLKNVRPAHGVCNVIKKDKIV
jgi:5-methylcytosine-specific restriction endonuclease McrA